MVVQGSYKLQVRAVSWTGTGYDSDGNCCDGYAWFGWVIVCDKTCDNKFKFCMRTYGYDTSSDHCPMGSYQTEYVGNNTITFETPIDNDVPNPMDFTGSNWPVRFYA